MPQLIDLAQNRKLTIRVGARLYGLVIPPISETVYFAGFFDALSNSLRANRTANENRDSVLSVAISFIEMVAISAEGYSQQVAGEGWQGAVPFMHKEAYSNALFRTNVLDANSAPERSPDGGLIVRLESVWNAGGTGLMSRNRQLAHHFKKPSSKQRDEARRAYLEVRRIAGFSHRGAPNVLTPSQTLAARTLVRLYGNLILRVEGYAVGGEPLTENRGEIVRTMDTFHKVIAARSLFAWTAAQMKERRTA